MILYLSLPACLYDSSSSINSSGFSMLSFVMMERYIGPCTDPPSTSTSTASLFCLESCSALALSFITCDRAMKRYDMT